MRCVWFVACYLMVGVCWFVVKHVLVCLFIGVCYVLFVFGRVVFINVCLLLFVVCCLLFVCLFDI